MTKDWKSRLGVVYSTNPDFDYNNEEPGEQETLPPEKQTLIVQLDKKNRKGKWVTLISGFVGTNHDLKTLGKELRTRCGVGGTEKNNEIYIQGDFRAKVIELLKAKGFRVKQSGG